MSIRVRSAGRPYVCKGEMIDVLSTTQAHNPRDGPGLCGTDLRDHRRRLCRQRGGGAGAGSKASASSATLTATAAKSKAKPKVKVGPRGPVGPKGATGPAGATGPGGPAGAAGAKGETGTAGANGTNVTSAAAGVSECKEGGTTFTSASGPSAVCKGTKGTTGTAGAAGSPWTAGGTLPAGATEKGTWSVFYAASAAGQPGSSAISLTIPMATEPEVSFVSVIDKQGTQEYIDEVACKHMTSEEREVCEKEPKTIEAVKAHEEEVTKIKEKCPGSGEAPTAITDNLCIYAIVESNFSEYLYHGDFPAGNTAATSVDGAAVVDDSEEAGEVIGEGTWAATG